MGAHGTLGPTLATSCESVIISFKKLKKKGKYVNVCKASEEGLEHSEPYLSSGDDGDGDDDN